MILFLILSFFIPLLSLIILNCIVLFPSEFTDSRLTSYIRLTSYVGTSVDPLPVKSVSLSVMFPGLHLRTNRTNFLSFLWRPLCQSYPFLIISFIPTTRYFLVCRVLEHS